MNRGEKMKIMVSACLLGENCKYNGGNNKNEKVLKYIEGHEIVPVCPEVMGGLPTPRIPSEIFENLVINREGHIVDQEFRKGAKEAFEIAMSEQVDLVILKAKSPSCGTKQIYDGTFSKTLIDGQGIFASMLFEGGIPFKDEDDIEKEMEKETLA